MVKKKSILFVCPYPHDEAPSQRFRFEQYLELLTKNGFQYRIAPFLNKNAWRLLYTKGAPVAKVYHTILSYLKRMALLFSSQKYEYIFVHREASPLGPPVFEWCCRYILKKKIIYDFDDAIWLDDPSEAGSLKARLKWKSKVAHICRWSEKVSVGNQYLAQFARQYNGHVQLNPTTIDTAYHRPLPVPAKENIVLGWTGTHSTMPYLRMITPILIKIEKEFNTTLLVISNRQVKLPLNNIKFIPWNKDSEIEDLNRIDIGLMPLTNDMWSKGKCGFKILQYMAVGKPTVASPVGVNEKFIKESNAGILASQEEEWYSALRELILSEEKREAHGENGKQYVKANYSTEANQKNFLTLF